MVKGWGEKTLGELLRYEQPQKYIVSSAEYEDNGVPVLTAGKSLILGYTNERDGIYSKLPVIIFDDFTTESKYITYRFKIKSSAMKLLTSTGVCDIRLVYALMQMIKFPLKDHQRYWISEYSKLTVTIPLDSTEQRRIAAMLLDIDALIAVLEKLITKKRNIKQGAMQDLLTGKRRLPGFSGEWVEKTLGKAALDIKTGKRNNEDKVENGKYSFFVRSQQVERINDYGYDCEAILIPGEGNIGQIFHYINGKFDCHQRVYKISNFVDVDAKFIFYYLKMFFGQYALMNTVKATVDSLRLPTFVNFEMRIPQNTAEQTAIAAILSDMDAEIDALAAKLAKLKHIKQGMMSELLTGKIRLAEQKHTGTHSPEEEPERSPGFRGTYSTVQGLST